MAIQKAKPKRATRKAAPRARTSEAPVAPPPVTLPLPMFPIVGIGASAGGLDPLLRILRGLGDSPAVAIVIVVHQEKSAGGLDAVLARATTLPVLRAEDGLLVEADRVYVAPPDAIVTLAGGRLLLEPRPKRERLLVIDAFLRSLAADHGSRAIAVILSGSGSDGALGSKAVKTEGGITFAQDATAEFPQMAHAAVVAGAVDFVLAPEAIAAEIVRIAHHVLSGAPQRFADTDLATIFTLLHAVHDVDFAHYKPATVERRIRRRMAMHKIGALREYIALLREDRHELEQLYGDILIRVTGFFRDKDVFAALKRDILPALVGNRQADDPLRLWVPGCSTGEEVYSLAIVLLEVTQDAGLACPIQIFGTDVSDAAIDHARNGTYGEAIAEEVSEERLRRFFTNERGGFRVAKAVRDTCVFARQNLTRDPPFSRLDLVSCRNVMIYLGAPLQRKVISIFHYALRPTGYLLLGSSETISAHSELFTLVDRRHKIYQKKPGYPANVQFDTGAASERVVRPHIPEDPPLTANVFKEADRVMLSRYTPPGVLIDDNLDVLQFRGRTSLFLEPPTGAASFNLLKMAREGLVAELRSAIHAARKEEGPVRREGLHVKADGRSLLVNLEVLPFITPSRERFLLVLFEEALPTEAATGGAKKKAKAVPEKETRYTERLKRELEATREYLQSIIEEQEAMNEELRSANEEIQSSNEELQSTNEELETAKEELQSSNEELTTLNEELEVRNQELAQVNDDLQNLLTSVDLTIVMLDGELRIRRFNPRAQRTLNLVSADIGRPIDYLRTTLVTDAIEPLIRAVIDNLEVREVEVQDRRGQRYALRVRPYKTSDNRIEGAVLVLIDK